ncbi:MAG: hypothetical protein M1562_00090 [Candidatus Marsarchaeota archaeon]|jgi:hypothetical protein|nr:hypothetical protein [Candidatus Marsarchaeota archaeon]
MVNIKFAPIENVIVHEVVKVQLEDLLRERITPAGSMPLYWCDGVLFSFSSAPMTKKIVDDYLDGTIHWMEVHYTEMRGYSPIMDLKDENYGGTAKVRVIDTSNSELHQDFARWLKKRK